MAEALHKIRARLYENTLTDNPGDYVARVMAERSLGIAEICQTAVERGGADVTPAAMEHTVNLFLQEMAYQLCDGFAVNTGYFNVGAHIRGVFGSPQERFDPQKHTVFFDFRQGAKLRRELVDVSVEIEGLADTGSYISHVTDVKTASVNDMLTPGRNLRIAGSKIKISGDDPTVGVWFVAGDDDTRTPVAPADIVTNNPKELIVVIPALPPGEYRIEVVTRFTRSKQLKHPRTATLDKVLTVE